MITTANVMTLLGYARCCWQAVFWAEILLITSTPVCRWSVLDRNAPLFCLLSCFYYS